MTANFHFSCTPSQLAPVLVPNFPPLESAVAGVMRDFNQLQHCSERESVAVPFLRRHHNYKINDHGHRIQAMEPIAFDNKVNVVLTACTGCSKNTHQGEWRFDEGDVYF